MLASALALAAALFAFSVLMSAGAPFGGWPNRIFGEPAWYELDPGSFYVAAAHDLRFGTPALFLGHPGTPLLLVLEGVQHAVYALAGGPELSSAAFTARNLPLVFFASKLLMTVLHLVSFAFLFAFARRLLRDELAAWCACLGYATSLPALYYVSRISVEPIMMICIFASFLALWRWEDLEGAANAMRARLFAALAGVAAVTGVVTKFNFMAPLPFLLLLEAALTSRSVGPERRAREKSLALLALASASFVTLWFWSNWIDWMPFFSFWSGVPPAWNSAARTWNLLPAPTSAGVLPLAEFAFVSVAVVGWVDVVRRGTAPRRRVLFVSLFLAFTLLVFLFRVYLERSWLPFHYFLPATGLLAVFFGAATARMLRGLTRSWPVAVAAGALWLLVVHGLAIYAVVDSRLRDVVVYQELRPTFEWIARLAPQQRIGVHAEVLETPEFAAKVAGLHTIMLPAPSEKASGSRVRQEFESLFVPIPPAQAEGLQGGFFVPALGTEVFPVEVREASPAAPASPSSP
jgi:hypothetical protein